MPTAQTPATAANTPKYVIITLLFLSVLVFAWGGNYTWVKLALQDSGPLTFNALRFLGATAIVGLCLVSLGRGRVLLPEPGERLLLGAIGFLQVALMTGLTSIAMLWIEASRTVLIAYSMPVWALLISIWLLGERTTPTAVAGGALGLLGLVLLTEPWTMTWDSGNAFLGSAIALIATIGWATGAVLYRTRRWRSSFWQQVFWQLAVAAVSVSLLAMIMERGTAFSPTPQYLAILLYNWIVPTSFGFWCWAQALSRISAASAGQFLLLSPVFGVFLSNLVLDEPLHSSLLISALFILVGAFLSFQRSAVPPQTNTPG
ncbi:DMT family transporter [Limibacillus halophilus]|uniref:Drug/metabolite transporter (DMT)-like permease n=1 Tax=Limibacillus halophilus TaxID=1579333 RepID=A0A839SMP8_9PROT|nr:DMT family transporter [Limibacillus halophilus]MBB3064177.1 drug/metabolite transporter (DMT)-like permease [Limibacillus halophilus]